MGTGLGAAEKGFPHTHGFCMHRWTLMDPAWMQENTCIFESEIEDEF